MQNIRQKTKIKKILFLILFLLLGFVFINNVGKSRPTPTQSRPTPTESQKPTLNQNREPIATSIFLPYWSLPNENYIPDLPNIPNIPDHPSNLIYFGIAPDLSGINKSDPGFSNLNKYLEAKQQNNQVANHYLALRMTNTDTNLKILENVPLQQKIRDETIEIAQSHGFDGIVLDLEVSALPTEELREQLNMFITDFSAAVKSENLTFMMTVYGDNFYRGRPYDLASLQVYTDQFLLMMYDLHKAAGEPGPNFPLSRGDQFEYDLATAVTDFLKVLPPEKITVVFGLYGYDWTLGPQGKPLKPAVALALNKIKLSFLNEKCQYKNCSSSRDNDSKETKVTYVDDSSNNHVVWFEDEESISKKIDFLKSFGISNFSFWAYGYY